MIEIKENIPLAPYTIYKIGGPARFLTEVKSSEELKETLEFAAAQGAPFFVLGAGSNVLVSDKGFDGLIIRVSGGELKVDGCRLIVDSGVMMARAVGESAKSGLTGFEWGIGIPGTIGGSVRGNAGCFGGEMMDIVESVEVFDAAKTTNYQLSTTNCEFAYRDSIFKKHPEWVIVSVTLKLQKGDPAAIQEKIKRITSERLAKQDIGTKSCGCIFKNIPWSPLEVSRLTAVAAAPDGRGGPLTGWTRQDVNKDKLLRDFPELGQFAEKPTIPASFLIDAAGLRGRRVGKVVISPKHANYFVNEGGGTAEEVVTLAAIAKDAVRRKYGLQLEEEIQYVGND